MAIAAQMPAVIVGVVAGTLSGLLGARLAMPIVPLFATAPEVSHSCLPACCAQRRRA